MANDIEPWYALLYWFDLSTLKAFTWDNRIFLYLSGVVPFLFYCAGSYGTSSTRSCPWR